MVDEPPTEEDELDPRILARWKPIEPKKGFAGRVLDEMDRRANVASPRRIGRVRRWAIALSIAAAFSGVAFWSVSRWSAERSVTSGTHAASEERASIDLGGVAVAVAEPSAELSFEVEERTARVEQQAGTVFYRVDRGTSFTVTTPAGVVEVKGTCFVVEVKPMREWKGKVVAAAAGAALTMTIVTVLEGRVTTRNDKGTLDVNAGEAASLTADEAPEATGSTRAAIESSEVEGVEELRARDASQRATIAKLEAQLKRSEKKEKERARADQDKDDGGPPKDKFHDLTPEELGVLADRCELRYDIPGYGLSDTPRELGADEARELSINEKERGALNRILQTGDPKLIETMREIYVELTGDDAGAKTLSIRNLQHEVFAKSTPQAMAEALERLSRERAGRAKPPKNLDGTSPVERLLRALAASGDQFETSLAATVGRERAHDLRTKGVGFGRRAQAQCPDELP